MPKVSVIIPAYNSARFLAGALESVLAQTFADWEAIIADDGSTDNTRELAARFSDPRVRYMYQENRGLPAARNAGINLARGKFVAFLDADDEWEPRFLEACLSELAARDSVAAVVTLTKFIDETGAVLPRLGGQAVSLERFRARLIEGGFFPVHAALVRTEAVLRAGMFDETLTSVEDWDLWLRISAREDMMCISEPLARYRVRRGSMSTNAGRMHSNRMAVLAKCFGAAEGEPAAWLEEKRRAYAFAYRSTALGCLQQQEPEAAWGWLGEAAQVWPPILERLDTFYELACGDQPRGYRGQAALLDLAANGAEMLRRLDAMFAGAPSAVQALRGRAYGNAYLALAMISDQAGEWAAARRWLLQAARHNPRLVSAPFVRRLVKVSAGKRAISLLKRLHVAADGGSEARSGAISSEQRE